VCAIKIVKENKTNKKHFIKFEMKSNLVLALLACANTSANSNNLANVDEKIKFDQIAVVIIDKAKREVISVVIILINV